MTVFLAASMRVTVSFTSFTPCLAPSAAYGVVIADIVVKPPTTRLLIGQLTNASPGSTNVTSSRPPENRRRYFAAVAPP